MFRPAHRKTPSIVDPESKRNYNADLWQPVTPYKQSEKSLAINPVPSRKQSLSLIRQENRRAFTRGYTSSFFFGNVATRHHFSTIVDGSNYPQLREKRKISVCKFLQTRMLQYTNRTMQKNSKKMKDAKTNLHN